MTRLRLITLLSLPILWAIRKNTTLIGSKSILLFSSHISNMSGLRGSTGINLFRNPNSYTYHKKMNLWLLNRHAQTSYGVSTPNDTIRTSQNLLSMKSKSVYTVLEATDRTILNKVSTSLNNLLTNIVSKRTTVGMTMRRSAYYHNNTPTQSFGNKYSVKSKESSKLTALYNADTFHKSVFTHNSWNVELIHPKKITIDDRLIDGSVSRLFGRKHIKFRLGIVYWAKKVYNYSKPSKFWNFMKGLSKHLFRGILVHSKYEKRLDIYISKNFPIKSLLFARILIKAGHVFVGSSVIKSPAYCVKQYNLVSISKRLSIYLRIAKYSDNNAFRGKKNFLKVCKKRKSKTNALRYARQQYRNQIVVSNGINRGIIFFGDYLDNIAMRSRKTNYLSPTSTIIQKMITSAWW